MLGLNWMTNLSKRFMNFTIGTKMVIVYVVVILLPTVFYSVYFYAQISHNIIDMYISSNQQLMEQSYSNFKAEISQIESIYQLFQYNNSVADFLSGYYTTESEELYAYLKDIKPLFAYGHASNSCIDDITIYKDKKSLVDYKYYILNMDMFGGNPHLIEAITPNKGLWVFDKDVLKFYKTFYSSDFYRELGFIQISVKSDQMLKMFNVTSASQALLFRSGGEWLLMRNGSLLKADTLKNSNPVLKYFLDSDLSKMDGNYPPDGKVLVNSLNIKELGIKAVLLTPLTDVMGNSKEYEPLINLALLLVILSLIYYIIISSVTRRMAKLAKHIRRTDHDNLSEYPDENYKDEIGALIRSYNEMILRIGSLVNSLNIAELKKKESDFHALQAQIKPHFIYNSLETIRMMAETNDDPAVAKITYSLGRFMRYNLSRKQDETLLKDEIENVQNYLQIYKVSMGDRLHYSINVGCDISFVKCPGFILQPLIENSLHHGLSGVRGRCVINVDVSENGEYVIITVFDNGAGISEVRLKTIKGVLEGTIDSSELKQNGNGIGIANVNERIKAYFGDMSGLMIDSEPEYGTTCTIQFRRT